MAITVNKEPGTGESLHYPLWHVVESSNVAQPGFQFVFDIYISATLVARVKQIPRPDNLMGVFDAAPIVRNYMNNYFTANQQTLDELLYLLANPFVKYTVKYGEQYAGTLFPNLTTTEYKAYNCYPKLFRAGVYGPLFGRQYSIITDRDKTIYMPRTGRLIIPYLNDEAGTDIGVQIERYDLDGVFISNNGFNLTELAELVLLSFSPDNINDYLPGFIDNTVGSYKITIVGDPMANTTSETYTVVFNCSKHEPEYLHFMNAYGGFDTMVFDRVNRLNESYERRKHEQSGFQFDDNDSWGDYNPNSNVYYEQKINHAIDHTYGAKLVSDYVNDTDYQWLTQLLKSPQVYYEKDNFLYPVTIKDSKWEQKKTAADKLFNLEMEIEFSHTLNSQFR